MQISIWFRNTKDDLFEITNTSAMEVALAEKYNHSIMNLNQYDLIIYKHKNVSHIYSTPWELFHKSENEEQSRLIKKFIKDKLNEKSQLLRQRQAARKIKSLDEKILKEIELEIKNKYFEININDFLNTLK